MIPLFTRSICLVFALAFAGIAFAQRPETQSKRAVSDSQGVVVGIEGHYRLGHLTAIRMSSKDQASKDWQRGQLRIVTRDGDGNDVSYSSYPPFDVAVDAGRELGYVAVGVEAAPLALHAAGSNGDSDSDEASASDLSSSAEQVVVQTRFPEAGNPLRGPALIPSQTPWVVSIGDPLGIDKLGTSNVMVDKLGSVAVTNVQSAASLPWSAVGYSGVDMVLINSSGLGILQQMKPAQHEALFRWLGQGGRVMVCLGQYAPELLKVAPWIGDAIGLSDLRMDRYDPADFESFTVSSTRLSEFQGVRLPKKRGRMLVSGKTTRRVSAPLVASYVYGFGVLTAITADFDRAPFDTWPERLQCLTRISGDLLDVDNQDGLSKLNTSQSFDDLAGQMRSTLEQFPIKASVSFAFLSLIVLVLVALIGPLDYLLINRFFGRPLLGWLTFPLVCVVLSGLLLFQARPRLATQTSGAGESQSDNQGNVQGDIPVDAQSESLRANQLQIIDFDLVQGQGRSLVWSSIYTHQARQIDVGFRQRVDYETVTRSVSGPSSASDQADVAPAVAESMAYPFGFVGRPFGGIPLSTDAIGFPRYGVNVSSDADLRQITSSLTGLVLAPRSSKSVISQTAFQTKVDPSLEITRRPQSEILRGTLTNPLPVDLVDAVLVYGNVAYKLPTRILAGQGIPGLEELRRKNYRWQLTQQSSQGEEGMQTEAWKAGDFNHPTRVAEMLMFYDLIGGELYTGLRDDVLSRWDASSLLAGDRCLLIGRTEQPVYDLHIKDHSQSESLIPAGQTNSFVRIVLPVRETRLD